MDKIRIKTEDFSALNNNAEEKNYHKGEIIYRTGDGNKLFIVKQGRVEFYHLDEEGGKYIVDYFKSGNIFGDFQLDSGPDMYMEAVEDTCVLSMKSDTFFFFLQRQPQLAIKIIKYLVQRLSILNRKSASIAIDNVFQKLIKLLIYLGSTNENTSDEMLITDKFTHEQLAQMLGVSRQIVTTILNDLERRKLIKREKKHFSFKKSQLLALLP